MMRAQDAPEAPDAALVAALFAVDPVGSGGVRLRSSMHPVRDLWLRRLRESLPEGTPWRRVGSNIADDRLLGGMDLAATLRAGRPILQPGVLAEADGGIVILALAERLPAATAARVAAALDTGEVRLCREGVDARAATRIGVVALDEGIGEEEGMAASLVDRCAFRLDFDGLPARAIIPAASTPGEIAAARARLPRVRVPRAIQEALAAAALALGAGSLRVACLAVRVAQCSAALAGRTSASAEDAGIAARLVLAPRATRMPSVEDTSEPAEPPDSPDAGETPDTPDASDAPQPEPSAPSLDEVVLAAAAAAVPAGLLARLAGAERGARPSGGGRSGALQTAGERGRPAGVRAGRPRAGARLNVIETLRAAAPWQALRGRAPGVAGPIRFSAEDLRVTRHQRRAPTLTIFAVDASGSAAAERLAEAKGAVELLLADCYVRRDQVAVLAFRGRKAELLLPPTRSLVRAKRSLAGLPGGGGTPLAAAIDAGVELAELARRRGETPSLVLLTDGRANVARDGTGARERAHQEALAAAGRVRAYGLRALFVDTSPRPNPLARDIAARMNALYVPLPHADARVLGDMLKTVSAAAAPRRSNGAAHPSASGSSASK